MKPIVTVSKVIMDVEVVAMDPCRGPGTPGTETLVFHGFMCRARQVNFMGVWSTLTMGCCCWG